MVVLSGIITGVAIYVIAETIYKLYKIKND